MRLFKFVSKSCAVLNIAKGSLKFTPIDELNDPSELTPVMDPVEVKRSLEILRENGMSKNQYKWLVRKDALLGLLAPQEKIIDVPDSVDKANYLLQFAIYDNLDYMKEKLFSTIRTIRTKIGVLSLSKRYDSLPMWAHYADLARGFVVVLDNLEHIFKGDETGSLNIPKPVKYHKEFIGMTFDPSTQDRLFFSKLSDWSYEREWRIVAALDTCCQSPDSKLYLRNVDPSHITNVICGWRVSDQDRSFLRNELDRVNPKTRFVSATLDGGRISLDPPLQ